MPADNGQSRVTIVDIARAAGVSKSTVSLVLQESPLVKPVTRERVRDAIRRLGYVYHRGAANLRRNISDVVGMVINDLTNPFFAEMAVGIEAALQTAGLVPFLANTGESPSGRADVMRTMREHGARGLHPLPGDRHRRRLLAEIEAWGLPRGHRDAPPAGRLDQQRGARQYRRRQARHRASARPGPPADRLSRRPVGHGRPRGSACRLGQGAARPPACRPTRHWPSRATPNRDGGVAALQQVLALPDPPTAALCFNDVVAIGVAPCPGRRRHEPPGATSPWSASTTSPTRA